MSISDNDDISGVHARLDRLEEELKEREVSFLRALKTLVLDFTRYQRGERTDFPSAAVLGAVFAYLRPRLVVTVAGLLAAVMAGLQVWLLLSQNRLIELQNMYIEQQTRAARVAAIQSVLSEAARGTTASEITLAQLTAYGGEGFSVLIQLAESQDSIGWLARRALGKAHAQLDVVQRSAALAVLVEGWARKLESRVPEQVEEQYLLRDYLRALREQRANTDYIAKMPVRSKEIFFRGLGRYYLYLGDAYLFQVGVTDDVVIPSIGEVEQLASVAEIEKMLSSLCFGRVPQSDTASARLLIDHVARQSWQALREGKGASPARIAESACAS